MRFRFKLALQRKLFILFSAIIVFPLVFCSILLYRQSVDVIEKNTGAMQTARLDYFADRFNLIIDKFYQELLTIAVNRNIRKIITLPMNPGSAGASENRSYLSSVTGNILFTDNMIHSIIIYSRIRDWLFVSSSATSNIYVDNLSGLKWLETAANRDWGVYMTVSPSVSPQAKINGENVISLFVSVRNMHDQRPEGYISINLDIRAIQGQLAQIFQRNNPQTIVIIDRNNNVISTFGQPVTLEALNRFLRKAGDSRYSGYFIDKLSNEQHFISHSNITRYGWKIFIFTPLDQILYQNRMITNIVIIIIVIFIILSICIAWILSVNLLNPLGVLFQAMRQIKDGKLAYTIPYTRTDEVGLLYDGFNEMSKNLNTMMEKLYQDELTKKDLQLKMMSYQINAHFLYNTLDVIHWIARINKVPKITTLVSSLVSYFRITLSEGNDIIPIRQVVRLAESYMNIYAIKSDFVVDFIVDIDKSLYEYKILKYIFQPLLENALNHGIEEKASNGIVRLSCVLDNNNLFFTISDTGAGIPPKKLERLQRTLGNSGLNEAGNFALRNINMQIKIYYGDQYGIKIESVLGEGANVYIRVPAITEDHHVQNAGV